MAAGAAGDGLFRGMYEGSIIGHDTGIRRRPYHKNCGCALHKSRGHCRHSPRNAYVSYPIRRSWSESSLALVAASPHSPSPSCSPTTANVMRRNNSMVFSIDEEDQLLDDDNIGSGKV